MKICIVATDYPGSQHPRMEFVKQVVDEWAKNGHECVVIAPFCQRNFPSVDLPYDEYQDIEGGKKVRVIRPRYRDYKNLSVGIFNLYYAFHGRAVAKGLRRMKFQPDFIYCHFWSNALEAFPYAKRKRIPLFVAAGEAVVPTKYRYTIFNKFRNYVRACICVSSKTKNECLASNLITPEKLTVIPNAINPNLFYKTDKSICREKLGFPQDSFIVAFTGAFCSRKGPIRTASAIEKLKDSDVYSLFIGRGDEDPQCERILYKGCLAHEQINEYLSAADIFVLPTRNEGCCNAIIEAMACGLPVISSNLPFNWDVLNEDNSIMVDPNNVDEIKDAIQKLKADADLRDRLSAGALKTAANLTIEKRAKKILEFIESCI